MTAWVDNEGNGSTVCGVVENTLMQIGVAPTNTRARNDNEVHHLCTLTVLQCSYDVSDGLCSGFFSLRLWQIGTHVWF